MRIGICDGGVGGLAARIGLRKLAGSGILDARLQASTTQIIDYGGADLTE